MRSVTEITGITGVFKNYCVFIALPCIKQFCGKVEFTFYYVSSQITYVRSTEDIINHES